MQETPTTIRQVLEGQEFEVILSVKMNDKIKKIAERCSIIAREKPSKIEVMSKDERILIFSMSKVAVQDIELQTGDSIVDYINTAAIAINLMFECGFKVGNDIIHYYQLIET